MISREKPNVINGKDHYSTKILKWNLTTLFLLSPGILSFGILFLYPMLITVATSLRTNDDSAGLTLANYVDFLAKPEGWNVLGLSFMLALAPTVIIVFLSIPFALILRKRFRGHRFYRVLMIIPLMIPSLISALGLLLFYNSNGWFNLFITTFLHLSQTPYKINYTIWGLVMFYVWLYFPYAALTISAAIEGLDKEIEAAARVCGASPFQVFRHILIPLITPAMMSGSIMTFLLAFGSFSVPMIAGGDYRPISVQVYTQSVVFRNWPKGTAIAVIMSMVQVLFLALYLNLMKKRGRSMQ